MKDNSTLSPCTQGVKAHINVRIIPGIIKQMNPIAIKIPTTIGPIILSNASTAKCGAMNNDFFFNTFS